MESENSKTLKKDLIAKAGGILIALVLTIILTGVIMHEGRDRKTKDEWYANFEKYGGAKEHDTTAVQEFNIAFFAKGGSQTGAKVKNLIEFLVQNAKENKDSPARIPCVSYNSSSDTMESQAYGVGEDCIISGYVNYLEMISKQINPKSQYYVVYTWGKESGMVRGVTINDGNEKTNNFEEVDFKSENLFDIKANSNVNNIVKDDEKVIANIKCSIRKRY